MAESSSAAAESELGKRQRNTIRNREAILLAAREVFCETGYEAATVRDIIRRTTLASGTFYNYFPDKQTILREIIEEFTIRLRHRVHEGRTRATTLEELLRYAYLATFQSYAEDETVVRLMARNEGAIRELVMSLVLKPAVEELAADLRQKSREGIVPPVDIDYVARAGVAIAAEVGSGMLEREQMDVDGATEFATQLMLGGIERLTRSS
ncbi:MAG: TetR/AcrR family transcriptional regulator [Candidatus Binatia bacterium]